MNSYRNIWAIHAPGHRAGDDIVIQLKSGKFKRVQLGREIEPGSGLFLEQKIPGPECAEEAAQERKNFPTPTQAELKAAFEAAKARKLERTK